MKEICTAFETVGTNLKKVDSRLRIQCIDISENGKLTEPSWRMFIKMIIKCFPKSFKKLLM